jgi:hypothetical protein
MGGVLTNACSSSSSCLNPQPIPPSCGETPGDGGGARAPTSSNGGADAGTNLSNSSGSSSGGGSSAGSSSGGGIGGGVPHDAAASDASFDGGGFSSGSGSSGGISSGSSSGCGDCSSDAGVVDAPFGTDGPSESDAPYGIDSGETGAPLDAAPDRHE